MTFSQGLLLFCAAILGGTLNAVAGGGSFICFPALVFTGLPAISANATNSVALWPGSVASVGAYRRELTQQKRFLLVLMICTSLVGGVLGALLLLKTPQEVFVRLVPYLLLVATLLFTFSGPIVGKLRGQGQAAAPTSGGEGQASSSIVTFMGRYLGLSRRDRGRGVEGRGPCADPGSLSTPPGPKVFQKPTHESSIVGLRGQGRVIAPMSEGEGQAMVSALGDVSLSVPVLVGLCCVQLVISVYGGYFGGGIGILMLAALAVMGMSDIHVMNALKTLLASCINGVAVLTFVAARVVAWPQAILMIVGAVIGGYGGAYYARKVPQKWVRLFVIVIGFSMTFYFFFLHK